MRTIIALCIILAAPLTADACRFGTCHSCRAKVVKQIYVPPTVNYFVGQPIRVEAIVQKTMQSDPLYQEFLKFKEFRNYEQAQASAPPQQQQPPRTSYVAQICARCHSGSTPSAQLIIDGVAPIDNGIFRRSMEILAGINVPDEMKSVIEGLGPKKADIVFEMLHMPSGESPSAQNQSAPPDIPAPPVEPQPNMQGKAARTEPDMLAFFGGK